MITSENKRRKWFEWGMVASFIALLSFLFTYLINWGGSMEATYQTRSINNGESKKIVVCLEDASINNINGLSITPTFKNNSRVSLKHFSLSFETECFGVTLEPSTFVEAYNYNESKCLFSYKDKELSAHDYSKPPFSGIIINSSLGWCKIKSKASFEGKSDAFECYNYVYFFVVPNNDGLNYTDWKKKCENCYLEFIKGYTFDLYYYAKNRQAEYLFDMSVGDAFVKPIAVLNTENMVTKNSYCLDNSQCEISRTDSTLSYNLTMNSDDTISKSYLLEGRIKPQRKQFYYDHDYSIVSIGKNQKTGKITHFYGKWKPPVIDTVSLYPQCPIDEVISIEKKKFSYIIRNKSAYAVVCCIHFNDIFGYITLNGESKTRQWSKDITSIEAFKLDRKICKEAAIPDSLYVRHPILFFILLVLSSFGSFIFVESFVFFVVELLMGKSFRKAYKSTFYYEISHYINWEKETVDALMSIVCFIMVILSPIGLFFCISPLFL